MSNELLLLKLNIKPTNFGDGLIALLQGSAPSKCVSSLGTDNVVALAFSGSDSMVTVLVENLLVTQRLSCVSCSKLSLFIAHCCRQFNQSIQDAYSVSPAYHKTTNITEQQTS